jgi:predicted enzyme related to lactoylglutathione lyase
VAITSMHLIVDDIRPDVARLCATGLAFCRDVIKGPGGRHILLLDPAGNPIELFHPANR